MSDVFVSFPPLRDIYSCLSRLCRTVLSRGTSLGVLDWRTCTEMFWQVLQNKMRARTVLNGLPPICCTTLHNPAEITCFSKRVGRVCMFQLDTEMFSLPYQLSYQLSSCNFSITVRRLRCQRFVAGYADWSSHARKIQTGSWSKRWVLCFSIYKMMGLHSRH